MSKEQIEEMARVLDEAKIDARATIGSMNYGFGMWYAKALYNAGYRKQSDLSPCDCCTFNPPSSFGGKPCTYCVAQKKGENE